MPPLIIALVQEQQEVQNMDFKGIGGQESLKSLDDVLGRLEETEREVEAMRERMEDVRASLRDLREAPLRPGGLDGLIEIDRALSKLIKSGRSEIGRSIGL